MEGEFRKLGNWLSAAVEKEKEEKVSAQVYEPNNWVHNDTICFLKKKKHTLRKDLCLSIQRCEYVLMFYQMACPVET